MAPQDRAPVGLLSVLHHYMRLFFHFKTSDEKVKNFIDIITSFVFLKSYLLAQVLVCVRVRTHQTLRGQQGCQIPRSRGYRRFVSCPVWVLENCVLWKRSMTTVPASRPQFLNSLFTLPVRQKQVACEGKGSVFSHTFLERGRNALAFKGKSMLLPRK